MLVYAFTSLYVCAQDREEKDIIQWKFTLSNTKVKAGQEADVIISAQIIGNWYLYSSDFKADIGPLPTELKFDNDESYQLVGALQPVGAKKKKDKTWDTEFTYFDGKAVFKQKIKLLKNTYKIAGTIQGQLCSETEGLCVPFKRSFAVD